MRLLLVDGRPEVKMDCLDGPEVLEGEVVVAILSPLPVWFGLWVYFMISQQELNMAAQN